MKPMAIHAIAVLTLVLAGCQRETPVPPPPAANAATTAPTATAGPEPAVVATETTLAQSGVQPDAANRAFAGTYTGTLPCADCPGIDETLVLDVDGSFVLTDAYRERPGSTNIVQGSWSVEGGTRIRLDPGSKDQQDRLFAIEGSDSLLMLDAEGKRIESPFDNRLVRGR